MVLQALARGLPAKRSAIQVKSKGSAAGGALKWTLFPRSAWRLSSEPMLPGSLRIGLVHLRGNHRLAVAPIHHHGSDWL